MAKQTSFRHPADIRHDERIAALIGNHGAAGYGIYWMIVEMLHRREDMRIEYNDTMLRRMSAQLGLEHMEFKVLLQELIELYELFARKDGYLVSTLVYRKPKKPRKIKTEVVEPGHTAPSEPAEQDSQSDEANNLRKESVRVYRPAYEDANDDPPYLLPHDIDSDHRRTAIGSPLAHRVPT